MSNYLFLLLVLACPLMMFLMMRGMHGGRGAGGDESHRSHSAPMKGCNRGQRETPASLEQLRRQRDELERVINEREQDERERDLTPTGSRR